MPCASSIEEAIALAQERWPGLELKVKTNDEACGPCPVCGQATTDGFLVFSSGYFFCRPGGHDGWLDDDKPQTLTREQVLLRKHEADIKRLECQQTEHEKRIAALERMARCTDHDRYHTALLDDPAAVAWAMEQGLGLTTILEYKIGKCDRCPTDREGRPSYTFPIWRKDGPLWSIRHRLVGATNGDKYRPHMAGLGTQLVGARKLADWNEQVVVVEGTKKQRVIAQHVPNVVGILGKGGFEMRWLNWFHPAASVCLMLDPDAQEDAWKLGHEIAGTGKRCYVASPPKKPDDMFVDGCTREEWLAYVNLARKVH